MSKILLHSLVDAPSPPDWMIEQANEINANGKNSSTNSSAVINNYGTDWTHRTLYKDGKEYQNGFNWGAGMDNTAFDWVRNNITKAVKDVRSNYTTPGASRTGPHVDRSRNFLLLYLLKEGGPDHKTIFYKQRGQDNIVRPWGSFEIAPLDYYDNFEELLSFRLTINRWNLLQTQVIHSVENISEGRFSIQVSVDELLDNIKLENPTYIEL